MLEGLKPFYNHLLKPCTRSLDRLGIRPNHITILGLFLFTAAGVVTAMGHWYYALILVVAGAVMDGLDGVLAREAGRKTIFGAILDSSCDRFTEFALLFGVLIFYLRMDTWFYGIVLCFTGITGSILVSYVKARCEGAGVPCAGGILQRPERIILLAIGLIAGPSVMIWILLALTLFSFFTVVQRLVIASLYCKRNNL